MGAGGAPASARPVLRRLWADGNLPDDTRLVARSALLRLREPHAVDEIIGGLAQPDGRADALADAKADAADCHRWRQQVRNHLYRAGEARLREAVPALRRLARDADTAADPSFHDDVVRTLLMLGDWEAVPEAIGLLDRPAPRDEAPGGPPGGLLGSALQACTGQPFGGDALPWRNWWDRAGRHAGGAAAASGAGARPGPSRPPASPEEAAAIERAFLEWARTRGAGVGSNRVVYVEDPTGCRRSTESVRYYQDAELRLLEVPRVRIHAVEVQGDGDGARALVNFYGPVDFRGLGPTVELTRSPKGWAVRGYTDEVDERRWERNLDVWRSFPRERRWPRGG